MAIAPVAWGDAFGRQGLKPQTDGPCDLVARLREDGGEVVAQGTPEEVAEVKESRTAPFLRAQLRKIL